MKHSYFEVTFRRGKPLAAYLYLPRKSGATPTRTVDAGHGLRIDYDEQQAIGVEVTAPTAVSLDGINQVLSSLDLVPLLAEEWVPVTSS